jgi:hypothetical protein
LQRLFVADVDSGSPVDRCITGSIPLLGSGRVLASVPT